MRKNIIRTFFAAVLIFSTLTVSAWAETGIIIGNGVNFREGPGTNYRVIATLDRGVAVNVTNMSIPGWYAVSCGGYNGFIASSYLSINSDSSAPNASYPSYGSSGGVSVYPGNGGVSVYPGSGGALGIYPDGYNPSYGGVSVVTPAPTYAPSYGGNGGVSVYPGTSGTVPSAPSYDSGNSGAVSGGVKEGYINAMYVRFRSGPSSSTTVIGEYNKGKAVQIYGYVDGWAACMIDGQPGYVYANYVTEGKYSGYNGSYWSGSGTTAMPVPNGGSSGSVSVVTPAPTYAPSYGYSGGVSVVPTYAPVVIQTPAPVATPVPDVNGGQGTLGYVVGSYVRFRSGPGTNYSILGTYNTGKAINILKNMGNGWLYCTIDNVGGYIHGDYVLVYNQASYGAPSQQQPQATQAPVYTLPPVVSDQDQNNQTMVNPGSVNASGVSAYICGNNVRFRSGPSMTSALLGEFFYGNQVTLYGIMDGWAAVVYEGTPGYVYAQYVKEGSYLPSTGTDSSGSTSDYTGGSSDSGYTGGAVMQGSGQDVANFALQFVGYNYKWGGSSPETGFDCSGFVYYVYKQFGYTMNRVAQDQVKNGVAVEPSAIQPGDVLCFYSGSSYIGHSGIYIGDGKFVHASNSTTGVIISELSGYYSARGFAARRIIP